MPLGHQVVVAGVQEKQGVTHFRVGIRLIREILLKNSKGMDRGRGTTQ
jgi:hypothetical protein